MREWLMRLRAARGLEWAAAAIAAGALALFLARPSADGATEYERRLQGILETVDGAGKVRVMVSEYQAAGETRTGVVITAQGGDDLRVALELSRAAVNLTGAKAEDVEVFAMGR